MHIITGSLAYDYIMDFPGLFSDHILPEKIHNINLSFIVQNFAKRRGGTAGNASYTLALLNSPHLLFSIAGKDFDEYAQAFTKIGAPIKDITIDKETYTATGIAMTDKKDNQIWAYSYGAGEKAYTLKLKKVAKKGDIVLIGPHGEKGSMAIVKQCIELNLQYIFDPGFILTQVSDTELTLGVKHAEYIIGNDYEITMISKRVNGFTGITKNKTVITTLAEKGAVIQQNGEKYKIPAAKPKKVVDPTGAGDTWRAGFLTGLERNFDIQTCGQMGAVASSYAVENYGTQEHRFTLKEFKTRYRNNYKTLLNL